MDAAVQQESVRIHEHIWSKVPDHRRSEDNRVLFLGGQVAGEGGEVEEETKKFWRGDRDLDSEDFRDRVSAELADVVISAYVLAHYVDVNIDLAIEDKQAELRERWGL